MKWKGREDRVVGSSMAKARGGKMKNDKELRFWDDTVIWREETEKMIIREKIQRQEMNMEKITLILNIKGKNGKRPLNF